VVEGEQGGAMRRLASGDWKVAYTVHVLSTQVHGVQGAARALETGDIGAALLSELVAGGADAQALAASFKVLSFSATRADGGLLWSLVAASNTTTTGTSTTTSTWRGGSTTWRGTSSMGESKGIFSDLLLVVILVACIACMPVVCLVTYVLCYRSGLIQRCCRGSWRCCGRVFVIWDDPDELWSI